MKLYRYEINLLHYSFDGFSKRECQFKPPYPTLDIKLKEFVVTKETPMGYWIITEKGKKWVGKDGRKKFAYENKKDAYNNFKIRTRKRIMYLSRDLEICRKALKISMENEEKQIGKILPTERFDAEK